MRKATFKNPFSSDLMFRSHSADAKMYAFAPYWQPTHMNITPHTNKMVYWYRPFSVLRKMTNKSYWKISCQSSRRSIARFSTRTHRTSPWPFRSSRSLLRVPGRKPLFLFLKQNILSNLLIVKKHFLVNVSVCEYYFSNSQKK